MRLLRIETDGGFSLVEYETKDIPPYAILSHTWGETHEEVTFRDLVEGLGSGKTGYRKLAFCGKQAAIDGLQFFWIDTCCIDKTSSAELSEAITSMFDWYKKAERCYAYLADVSIGTSGPDPEAQIGESSFRKSRWFTRGWTLQELIAPVSVMFFSEDAHRLGDKKSLEEILHEITGIASEALRGSPLSQFSIEERVSWTEGRDTKKEEDVAYSLLGIFNVQMPPLYGEGRQRALDRLRREIAYFGGQSLPLSLAMLSMEHSQHEWEPSSAKLVRPVNPETSSIRRPTGIDGGTEGVEIPSYSGFRNTPATLQLMADDMGGLKYQHAINNWLAARPLDEGHDVAHFYDKQVSSRLEDEHEHVCKILWISAPPGYGKTVLCARLVEHLNGMQSFPIAYFFASPHAQSGGEPNFIIRSWISQIVQLDVSVLDLIRRHFDPGQRISEAAIWSLFGSIVSTNRNYTFVLDGLDEYSRSDDVRAEFLQKLKKSTERTASRILITSRKETDIEAELSAKVAEDSGQVILQCKIVKEDVQEDVSNFSRALVDKKLPNKDSELRHDLAVRLSDKCEGMFLWIKLQQDQLRSTKNAKQLQKVVNNMPSGLYQTYERNLNTILSQSPEEKDRGLAILRWTALAFRPLAISEITEALIVELNDDGIDFQLDELPDEIDDDYIDKEIIDVCGALVEVKSEKPEDGAGSKTIHLIHASVREFLLPILSHDPAVPSGNTWKSFRSYDQGTQHEYLAMVCLGYLNDDDVWEHRTSQDHHQCRYTFTDYVARYWNSHTTAADKRNYKWMDLVKGFLRSDNKNFHNWRQYLESPGSMMKDYQAATPLYYAALFNFPQVMEHIWAEEPSQLNEVGGEYGTPLQAVCVEGHESAFKLLLGWGQTPTYKEGATPLQSMPP